MHGTLRFLNLSHLLYGIRVNIFIMKSVYFKELRNEQEYYCPTIYRAGAAVVSTITSFTIVLFHVSMKIFRRQIHLGNCRSRTKLLPHGQKPFAIGYNC